MSKLPRLFKAVCGLDSALRFDGRLCPSAVKGWMPVAISHDRRLSAGIFTTRRRRRRRPSSSQRYRIVVWRTYRDRGGRERATTLLYRDEIDPALSLISKCGDRMPTN